MTRSICVLAVASLLASCGGKGTSIKRGAFDQEKIQVSTVGQPAPHKADIVIAVLPFNNNSPDKSLDKTGVALADLISAQLAPMKGFRLVERQRIEEIFSELKLGLYGAIDQDTAVRIGGMLGANVMAFGGFSTIGKKVLLTVRLVKVETAEIVGGAVERGDDISNLDVLAENAAKKLSDSMASH
jgi:TolB-like protein